MCHPVISRIAIVPLVMLSALALAGCHKKPPENTSNDAGDVSQAAQEVAVTLDAAQVELAGIRSVAVQRGAIDEVLHLNGEVTFDRNHLAHIGPRLGGTVEAVVKVVGDRVEAGEVLVVLISQDLAAAKSAYLASSQRRSLARTTAERVKSLWEDKIAAEQDHLDAQQALAEANIEFQAARQTLFTLGLDSSEVDGLPEEDPARLSRYEVRAPFAGTLVSQSVAQGEQVLPDTELFVLARLDTLWVIASVYEEDVAKVALEQTGRTFVAAFPDVQFIGTVGWIADAMDEQTRTLQIRLETPNEQRLLKAGMFADVVLVTRRVEGLPTIPATSLQTEPGSSYVFVDAGEGRFERRTVTIGIRSDDVLQVVGGVSEGERVVIEGAFLLKSELEKGSFGDDD